MSRYLLNLAVGIDQLANTLIGGAPDETLSARAHRMRAKGQRWWGWTANSIDRLFFWQHQHCYHPFVAERERRQLPGAYHQDNHPFNHSNPSNTTKATP